MKSLLGLKSTIFIYPESVEWSSSRRRPPDPWNEQMKTSCKKNEKSPRTHECCAFFPSLAHKGQWRYVPSFLIPQQHNENHRVLQRQRCEQPHQYSYLVWLEFICISYCYLAFMTVDISWDHLTWETNFTPLFIPRDSAGKSPVRMM